MKQMLKTMESHLHAGEALVLVTVTASSGATPRGAGARMLVGKNGRICGTIGGGAVEYRSEQIALQVLEKKISGQQDFSLTREDVQNLGMICGGDVNVFFHYAVYHGLPEGITVVGCHAHLRRKFDDAIKSLPKGKVKGSSAYQGLAYCDLLFAIEKGLDEKNATTEERYKERLEQAKPVLDAMFAWANSRTAAPKSALGKAFTYLKEQWPYLTNYLKDGRLELSNNRAERSIKPFVISRKNFLFANTPKGAAGSANMFSLIHTAIENGLEPYKYLTWLMKTAKDADLSQKNMIRALLPWNALAECHTK